MRGMRPEKTSDDGLRHRRTLVSCGPAATAIEQPVSGFASRQVDEPPAVPAEPDEDRSVPRRVPRVQVSVTVENTAARQARDVTQLASTPEELRRCVVERRAQARQKLVTA